MTPPPKVTSELLGHTDIAETDDVCGGVLRARYEVALVNRRWFGQGNSVRLPHILKIRKTLENMRGSFCGCLLVWDRYPNLHVLAGSGLEVRRNCRFEGLKNFAGTSHDLVRPPGPRERSVGVIAS